tara:strand:- start:9774 stop:11411 length:1638 start_codon:yes stop_codon:yes gene_type:complete
MLNLKSVYFYFLATKINFILLFRKIYLRTNRYNKSLNSKAPEKLYFYPSPLLLSSFTNQKDFSFKVSEVNPEFFWSNKNNKKLINDFLWLNLIDRKNDGLIIQKIIKKWIDINKNYKKVIWDDSIINKRIISWILNADIILKNTNIFFKEEFFTSLIKQVNHLKKSINFENDYSKKIKILCTILLTGLVFKEYFNNYKNNLKELEKLISIFFDKDGFPLNYNPEQLLDLTKYLILIKECISDAQQLVPDYLENIIEKNINCIRSISSSNYELPLFNGSKLRSTKEFLGLVDKLKYPQRKKKNKVGNIQIIKYKKNLIHFDIGSPPKKSFSQYYQSGPLSFEYYFENEKVITNCGYGDNISKKAVLLSRLTSAQSTLCINDTSVAKFERNKIINNAFGDSIKTNFKVSDFEYEENQSTVISSASHDAYKNDFDCIHSREIKIDKKENIIFGKDKIMKEQSSKILKFNIFFHLFPGISAVPTLGGESILIHMMKNKSLIFKSPGQNIYVEKSIFLGGNKILNNLCINLSGNIHKDCKIINWEISRTF